MSPSGPPEVKSNQGGSPPAGRPRGALSRGRRSCGHRGSCSSPGSRLCRRPAASTTVTVHHFSGIQRTAHHQRRTKNEHRQPKYHPAEIDRRLSTPLTYDVAISFAGEQRREAEAIASRLRAAGVSVFYDAYEQADLWGKNLYDHLPAVYEHRARYCLMLVSAAYGAKVWTNTRTPERTGARPHPEDRIHSPSAL